jgi:dUTP pyrophosphatase
MVEIKIKKLSPEAIIPHYAHEGDAGMDLYSIEDAVINPQERKILSTGLAIELPAGYCALIWDKGGLAAKNGIKTMGGVFEYTYRGEYKIILLNTSSQAYEIKKGEKIAQVLIQPIVTAQIKETTDLTETKRGEGRFGSTGLKKID